MQQTMTMLSRLVRKRRRRSTEGISATAMAKTAILATTAVLALMASPVGAIFGIGDKRFTYEGLIDAGSLGMDDVDGQVVAFGDFNGDSFIDAFVLSRDRKRIDVRLWDHNNFRFSKPQAEGASSIQMPDKLTVSNVVPADFNFDGKLDVLVMMFDETPLQPLKNLALRQAIWLADLDGRFEKGYQETNQSTYAHPILLDSTGDMRPDLLGHSHEAEGILSTWTNTWKESNGTRMFSVAPAPLNGDERLPSPKCQLDTPHSSAFVDMDGDCLADLFLDCESGPFSGRSYEIWTADKEKPSSGKKDTNSTRPGYTFARKGNLPKGTGALTFADMDGDGTIDVVFPTCDDEGRGECYINIAYNRQIPLCSNKHQGWFGVGPGEPPATKSKAKSASASTSARAAKPTCRDPEANLCTADSDFLFNFDTTRQNDDLLRLPISAIVPENRILQSDDLLIQPLPVPLSIGDFNKDGFPDLAIITVPTKKSKADETRVRLLTSVSCEGRGAPKPGCPDEPEKRAGRRTFEMLSTKVDAIEGINDARSISFLDIDEDGSLDMMIQRLPLSGATMDRRRVSFIQNNFFYDAFMLKAITLNGACSSYCEPAQGEKYKPSGVNYAGASYKFTVLDTNGNRRAQQVGQLAQTSFRALLTPYSFFGLGRTNNYVESLFVGSTRRQQDNYLEMEGVIPNSQVVILPWQQGQPGDPSTWIKELYLSPGDWIPIVTVVLVTIVVILLGFVFVLHLHERREDERERKRAVHAINFDAL